MTVKTKEDEGTIAYPVGTVSKNIKRRRSSFKEETSFYSGAGLKITAYRYPDEKAILYGTLLPIMFVLLLASAVSLCTVPLLTGLVLLITYSAARSHHEELKRHAQRVTPQTMPKAAALVNACARRLQPGPVDVFVVRSQKLNAYTFGIDSPKALVLYEPLLRIMDADELRFIIGHEMGHVALGHTWLNSLIGGLAGVPTSLGAAVVVSLIFRSWNRACEYSADRAGLLACGNITKAITALVKLVNHNADTPEEIEETLRLIDMEDDRWENRLSEILMTHPMSIKRIEKLRNYTASAEYQKIRARMDAA
ncbi:MAG: M48 family metallopeptidase [Anaerolineaceae bacterium]|nr:M48 family metallopeptidase [Anaerolineaceae bacterium]